MTPLPGTVSRPRHGTSGTPPNLARQALAYGRRRLPVPLSVPPGVQLLLGAVRRGGFSIETFGPDGSGLRTSITLSGDVTVCVFAQATEPLCKRHFQAVALAQRRMARTAGLLIAGAGWTVWASRGAGIVAGGSLHAPLGVWIAPALPPAWIALLPVSGPVLAEGLAAVAAYLAAGWASAGAGRMVRWYLRRSIRAYIA